MGSRLYRPPFGLISSSSVTEQPSGRDDQAAVCSSHLAPNPFCAVFVPVALGFPYFAVASSSSFAKLAVSSSNDTLALTTACPCLAKCSPSAGIGRNAATRAQAQRTAPPA